MEQLFRRHGSGPVTHVSGFVAAGHAIDSATIGAHYESRVRSAPRRTLPYIAERSIDGRAEKSNRHEEILAHSLFENDVHLQLSDDETIRVVDFQTPLDAGCGDGAGKIDLLGNGDSIWVVELKVRRSDGSADTPLMALLEAIGYAAVVEANIERFDSELAELGAPATSRSVAVMVLAPEDYWLRWDESPAALGWRDSLRSVSSLITEATGIQIVFGSFDGSILPSVTVTDALDAPDRGSLEPSIGLRPDSIGDTTSRASVRIERQQRAWATTTGLGMIDSRHAETVEANLLHPLSESARVGIAGGDGSELDSHTRPPRLSNLRSSTALALNVFDSWVGRELGPLTGGLGVGHASRIRFEVKYPTGLGGTPPNLDVVLDDSTQQSRLTAIEAKFVEPYDGQSNDFKPSYFENVEIWRGLSTLRQVAEALNSGEISYRRLKAAQLIKHSLGLSRECGATGFVLIYLWYDFPSTESALHREELEHFLELARNDIDVRSVTYQDLVAAMSEEPIGGYFEYLEDRYGISRDVAGC